MTRVAHGIKNTKLSLFFFLVLLFLTFFSRKIFIDILGADIVGLNSTIINILDIVNLSELGIGTAIAASLYKPLYDKDNDKVNDIISVLGYFYRVIGFIVIGIGAILFITLPFLFEGKGVSMGWVYLAFSSFFICNLVAFFISYQQTLLTADQKFYEITVATNIFIIVRVILQIILLKYFGFGYITWLILEVIFAFVLGLWLVFRVKKLYPWLDVSIGRGRKIRKLYPELFIKSKQVIPHRISNVVLTQTDNIVILIISSFNIVTLYVNYAMLATKSIALVSTTFNGLIAGVGNLIAQGNIDSVRKLFWELNAMFMVVASLFGVGLYFISSPFVALWLGDEFVLDNWVVLLLSVNTFMAIMRLPLAYMTNGYSLFKDTWAPWCEMGLNLVLSFALGYLWGIAGVMAATAVSVLFMHVWKPYFFYREVFKESVWGYWIEISKYIIVLGGICCCIYYIFIKNELYFSLDNYWGLIVNCFVITVIVVGALVLFMYPISQGMRDFIVRILGLVKLGSKK